MGMSKGCMGEVFGWKNSFVLLSRQAVVGLEAIEDGLAPHDLLWAASSVYRITLKSSHIEREFL